MSEEIMETQTPTNEEDKTSETNDNTQVEESKPTEEPKDDNIYKRFVSSQAQKAKYKDKLEEKEAELATLKEKLAQKPEPSIQQAPNDSKTDSLKEEIEAIKFVQKHNNVDVDVLERVKVMAKTLKVSLDDAYKDDAIQALIEKKEKEALSNNASINSNRSPRAGVVGDGTFKSGMKSGDHKSAALKKYGFMR
jgi:hypothetical protein